MNVTDPRTIGFPLWNRAIAREVDRVSTETYGIHPLVLMERAGHAVADLALDHGARTRDILVLAGPGNNGGDALVAARYLADAGCNVSIFLVVSGKDAKLSSLCLAQKRTVEALGLQLKIYQSGDFEDFQSPLVLDGVFGIGFRGKLKPGAPSTRALSEAAKLTGGRVIAIDVPSGVDCDCGTAQHVPLTAHFTVTFGARKPAHVLSPARDVCGEVLDVDIGFPSAAAIDAMEEHPPPLYLADAEELSTIEPWAEMLPSMHKYDRGHILVIGGSPGKTGAPLLTALSSLRAGGGWATVAMSEETTASLKGDVPREITFESLFAGEDLDADALAQFIRERKVRGAVIGPGMVRSPLTSEVMQVLIKFQEQGGFLVLDAAATDNVGVWLEKADTLGARLLLTPHPGEWTKMAKEMPDPLDPEGLQAAKQLASRWHATLMFKNAAPIVISPDLDAPAFVVNEGTAILARAGSGDVLAGIAAVHGALGFDATPAALRAQVILAHAAETAAESVGLHGVLARDIIGCLTGSEV